MSEDWPTLATVFLPDATADLSSGTDLVGLDAIVDRVRTALQHFDDSQHLVGNHEVAVACGEQEQP